MKVITLNDGTTKVTCKEITPRGMSTIIAILKNLIQDNGEVTAEQVDITTMFESYDTIIAIAEGLVEITVNDNKSVELQDLPFSQIVDEIIPALREVNAPFLGLAQELGMPL